MNKAARTHLKCEKQKFRSDKKLMLVVYNRIKDLNIKGTQDD